MADGGLELAIIILDAFLEDSVSLIEGGLTVPFLRFIFLAPLRRGFLLLKILFETKLPFNLLLLLTLLILLTDEVLIDLSLCLLLPSGESSFPIQI